MRGNNADICGASDFLSPFNGFLLSRKINMSILQSSAQLVKQKLGDEFEAEYMGNILLRGKGEEIKLYSLIPLKNIEALL